MIKYVKVLEIEKVINRKYKQTYNPDKRSQTEVELFKYILKDKGIAWLIVAIVDGSHGYYSHKSAEIVVNAIVDGTIALSERCMACYQSDLMKMVFSDIRRMFRIMESDEDTRNKQKNLRQIEDVDKLLDLTIVEQMTLSALYPTS